MPADGHKEEPHRGSRDKETQDFSPGRNWRLSELSPTQLLSDHAFVDRLVHKLDQVPTRQDIRDFLPLLQEYKARVSIVH